MNLGARAGSLPEGPGVYLFLDPRGRVVYVGKSVNLRRRVASYFGRSAHPEVGRMMRGVAGIDYRETPTEILALLLEDDLIKEHLPVHNVRQKQFPHYHYLALSEDRFPTLAIVDARDSRFRRVFGPYRDEYLARDLRLLLARRLGLRPCASPEPASPCADLELGTCAGPCAGRVGREEYGRIVEAAAGFLTGQDDRLLGLVEEAMRERASRQAFEEAAALRDEHEFCRRFLARQRFLARFASEDLVVFESRGRPSTYVFRRGRSYARYDSFLPDSEVDRLLAEPVADSPLDERRLLDRAAIVYSWIEKAAGIDSSFFRRGI